MANRKKAPAQKVRLAPRKVAARVVKLPEVTDPIGEQEAGGAGGNGQCCKTARVPNPTRDPLKEKSLAARVKILEEDSDRGSKRENSEMTYVYKQLGDVGQRSYEADQRLLARIEALELAIHGKIQDGN